ncbi:penicillin-binding protein [Companilactobacillus sp. RD055328]|uniref:PBP1A family penicillin-binding protein n=1 Tax=Companilactobacillus sp. RD055328 TaxID=2916634 RepID=UPI001FC8D134|nr:PBP1A family penicillin-binding protein [Companilactobacillus sp. RD055328]GKQ42485.1 penicillin-binding protein [Companilactobacillus sp. RD055328]
MKNFFAKVSEFFRPFFDSFDNGFRRAWKRYQITRWIILVGATIFLILSAYFTFKAKTADVGNLKSQLQTTTTIVDAKGNDAGSLYSQKGTFVDIDEISTNIQDAVISTEDRTFWTNSGVSFKGYMRAAVGLVLNHGQISGGGSTITQQLAKNSLLSQKQTFMRKAAEFFMAVEINKTYSKKDILAMYLNNAYFGNGVWGVEDASMKYFGKHANSLDVAESAVLAAMLKSPSYYNPIDNPDNSVQRRNLVIDLMVENNKISKTEATAYKKESLNLIDRYQGNEDYKYPYYFDAVIAEAINKYGLKEEDIMNKGYKIYTSLNQDYQKSMQDTFEKDWLFPNAAADGTEPQAASVAINPKSGGVEAVVGGRGDHVFRGLNRATQIKRQPGSAIKPLAVYTPAIENGYRSDSMLPNEITSFGKNNYTPKNVDGSYSEEIPLYKAIAYSKNIPAVSLLDKIGVKKGVNSVENFGINVHKDDQNLALALGGLETGVSPLQMATAYTAFANDGKLADEHFITKIVDSTGAVVVDNTSLTNKQIISSSTAKTMTSLMLGVFNYGTAQSAKPYGYEVAGKTGSTEVPKSYGYGTKDQWLIGYTPDVVVASWIGFDNTDENHFLSGTSETGVSHLYKAEMTGILPYSDKTDFTEKDPVQTKNSSQSANSGNWVDSIQNGYDSIKENATQWYNSIRNIF